MAAPHGLTIAQAALIEQEDKYRQLFSENRRSDQLSDPYVLLLNVFDSRAKYQFEPEESDEVRVPKILCANRHLGTAGEYAVCTKAEFNTRWAEFTGGVLDGLDWNNVFVAGGAVLACSLADREEAYQSSDIDFFITGLESSEAANNKLRHIAQVVERNAKKKDPNFKLNVVRSHRAVTILGKYPQRHIQIILRLYKSPAEVLLGFDIDSCTIGYDGSDVYSTERFRRSLTKGYNLANPTRRSLTYETRLRKYSKRGFAVAVPDLDKTRVDPSLFSKPFNAQQGLAKLLTYEYYELNPKSYNTYSTVSRRFFPKTNSNFPRTDNYTEDAVEEAVAEGQDSDYAATVLPWGPKWPPGLVLAMLDRADKAQFFSGSAAPRRRFGGRPAGPSGGNQDKVHKHLYVSGLETIIQGALLTGGARTAGYCQLCNASKPWETDDTGRYVDSEPLKWISDCPVYQDMDRGFSRSLMTGSFQPVMEQDWTKDVYLDPSAPPIYANNPLLGKGAASISNNNNNNNNNSSWLPTQKAAAVPVETFVCENCQESFSNMTLKWKHMRTCIPGGMVLPAAPIPAAAPAPSPSPSPVFSFGSPKNAVPIPAAPAPSFSQPSFGFGSQPSSFSTPPFVPTMTPIPHALPAAVPTHMTVPHALPAITPSPVPTTSPFVHSGAVAAPPKAFVPPFVQPNVTALRGSGSVYGSSPEDFGSGISNVNIMGNSVEDFGGGYSLISTGRSRVSDVSASSSSSSSSSHAATQMQGPSWWPGAHESQGPVLVDGLAKTLLLVTMLAKKQLINAEQKTKLKDLALCGDHAIISILLAFDVNPDHADAAESFKLLLARRS
eukprot:TRINITY_DN5858_c0_g1_i1.p1 TRINITY_DN5858_c0_g1~~TRINITY_DN5858_c0_g1_i1.p1  ORF type:complete len:845 (+),score=160.72 TRINITY_DN5858_c0_g1_i1:35-2536(+)